jgi:hypothetical protein
MSAGTPADVAQQFFLALEEERWKDAADMLHPDLVSARAQSSLERIAWMKRQSERTVEDVVSRSPGMPREAAQFMLDRDASTGVSLPEQIERTFHGYSNEAAARSATPTELLASELQANDVRTRAQRAVSPGPWMRDVIRIGARRKVIGEVHEAPDLAHVLYREALVDEPTPDNSLGLQIFTLARVDGVWYIVDDSVIDSQIHFVPDVEEPGMQSLDGG